MSDTIAGRYRIVREIARSNDVVYEAVDTTTGRRLAIKELLVPANLAGQARQERIERFTREARATARLTHPNVVTVFDHGEDAGRFYIAMEYLEGGTLRDALQAQGALPQRQALDIARQILAGLAHAHGHRVVHRDVKPDNIHLLPGGQAKLTDFGIARLTEEASLTGAGQVFGTPSYMSPEQIEGKGLDHRSDIFSVGVVLYEMLSGRKPFTGDTVVTITYNIMHTDPPGLVGIPYQVEQCVFRAMEKDPARRFLSADHMRQALFEAETAPAGAPAAPVPASPPSSVTPPPVYPGAPSQTAANVPMPFADWSVPGGAQQAAAPALPSLPRPRARRSLSPAARGLVTALVWAVCVAAVLLGVVMLFARAYEQQRERGRAAAGTMANERGKELYRQGNLKEAASYFERVLEREPSTPAGTEARTNLAITLNRLGVRTLEAGDLTAAEAHFSRVLDLYALPETLRTDQDRQVFEDARYNLARLYERMGRSGPGTAAPSPGGLDGAQADPDAVMREAYARAVGYLKRGEAAYREGRVEEARDWWAKAAAEAPGYDVAVEAQRLLQQTRPPLSF